MRSWQYGPMSATTDDSLRYDLVIRGGTVVDGSGRPRYRADVGVVGDRIASIGQISGKGRQEVDAEGCFVTPGFIDGHTHLDAQTFWDPLATSTSYHGVTTAVMGNCGFTIAPVKVDHVDLVFRSLERAEDMAREALIAGVPLQWETFPEYLDVIDGLPKGLNMAGYVGHSALRTYVMGERAYHHEASPDDLAAMLRELDGSLRAGAIGFSTSRSANHATSDDHPVASRQATRAEVEALVGRMGHMGAGVFQLANEIHYDPVDGRRYHEWLRDLAVTSGRPITFIIGTSKVAPGAWRKVTDLCAETAAAGGRMVGTVHAREFATVLSFRANLPFDKLPTWSEIRRRPLAEQRAALVDPTMRARLVSEAMHGPYGTALGAEAREPDWDWVWVYDSPLPPHRRLSDLAAAASRTGGAGGAAGAAGETTPVDVMIDLALASDFDQLFLQPFANHIQDDVLALLRHPGTMIGASDSGAHVSQITDASIPTHLLAHWVRAREAITWEHAIKILTSDPAGLWGFDDRGLVVEGRAADMVVFDPATVAPCLPSIECDQPAGAKRIVQRSLGFRASIVNGEPVFIDGEPTGAVPGRLLRGPLAGPR